MLITCCFCTSSLEGGGDELRGWEAPALGRIDIKYVRSRDDLAWYLASLHTLRRKQWPTVIAGKHGENAANLNLSSVEFPFFIRTDESTKCG